jgi:glycosyltransferase involved in cell wall biosynthesis
MSSRISIIIPTLNEEKNIQNLLGSLEKQTLPDYEVIIVDGGSTDGTVDVANDYHSRVIVEEGLPEFPSRNTGAKIANGEILLFTCADVIFPRELLAKIDQSFEDQELIALTGPDYPTDSLLAEIEYGAYNFARFMFSSFPKPTKRFSASTNFLAVRKATFEKTGGFLSDINGDGLLGKRLSEIGKVKFLNAIAVTISARRFCKMGFFKFNLHYLYVLENFFPFLSKTYFLKILKNKSDSVHQNMHLTDVRALSAKKNY